MTLPMHDTAAARGRAAAAGEDARAPVSDADFRLDRVLESLTGTHRHYTQYIDGIPVDGTARIESITREGRTVSEEGARRRLAGWSAAGSAAALLSAPTADARLVYLNLNGEAHLTWRFTVEQRRLEPYAHWIDAYTGQTLQVLPLFWTAKARVFDVNPVAKLNDPTLRDDNNAASAVPDAAYDVVDLVDLAASGPLAGPNAMIVDAEPPNIPPVDVSQPLLFDRSQSGFEDVNAYFQIDRSQRYMQSLGYTGGRRIIGYVLPIDAHAANGTDNSYYIGGSVPGRGTLFYGVGGTDDAEDSDIMLHELGHAIQDWIAPGTFNGSNASQSRALGEGFGDYWAFSSTYEATAKSGRDPFCLADWDARCGGDNPEEACGYPAGADCLRRVDSPKTMLDYIFSEVSGAEHRNGEIWSSALREIFLGAGKRATDTIVLEAHFGTPPNPTFAVMARRILDADRLLNDGANAAVICAAMARRGILTDCDRGPRGELTWLQSGDRGIPIPDGDARGITSSIIVTDTRRIARVAVHLEIAHPARGDLRITLTAPDGTEVLLQNSSLDRTPNLRATFGIDALAAQPLDVFNGLFATGEWKLNVADVLVRDTGTLVSWSLVLQFEGDAPQAARPSLPAQFPSRFIPVAAHLFGANGAQFLSDVYLYNRGAREQTVTLVFTPSGADGMQRFAAVKIDLPPNEQVVLEDVVAQLFQTAGSGAIEVQGDVRNLVITSSTYDRARGLGETVPALAPAEGPLRLVPAGIPGTRLNLGFAETRGASGIVQVTFHHPLVLRPPLRVPIAPFGHVQIGNVPQLPPDGNIAVTVEVGDARVVSYASFVDDVSGDPMFVKAAADAAALQGLPAIEGPGAFGSQWSTDLWTLFSPATFYPSSQTVPAGYYPHAGVTGHIEASDLIAARIDSGHFGELVAGAAGRASGDVLHVESSPALRTNFGLAEVRGETAAVRVTLFDAGGHQLASGDYVLGAHEQIQLPLSALYGGPLTHGVLRFVENGGAAGIVAYASIVNNATNDFVFLPAE